MKQVYSLLLWGWMGLLAVSLCRAQDTPESRPASEIGKLNVYLDCNRCDTEYIRQEITFINYVRDWRDSDVHVLVTTERTGSGGTAYTLLFNGHKAMEGLSPTLTYASSGTDTRDQRRQGLVRVITLGLVPFITQTSMADQVSISIDVPQETTRTVEQEDKWNNWVFRVGVNGSANGQQTRSSYEMGGNLSATRTTEDWKIRLAVFGEYGVREFKFSDEKQRYITRDGTFSGLIAKSLGPQWALGLFGAANTSSFENTDLSMEIAPAIEYNLFPYSESSRREFRFTYRMNLRSFKYEEETIFGQTAETRLNESLAATFEVNQPWGSADATLEMSHYLHDFSKNRLEFFLLLNIQLIRGLSFNIFGRISRTQDQLFLAAEDATDEEILLNQRQLATTYEYRTRIGFTYRFGSIFNNVVNSRFG